MSATPEKLFLSFYSGGLTILSPCMIPVLPLLVGSAFQRFKYGPVAILSGLVVAFTWATVNLASLGSMYGIDQPAIRKAAALVTILFGLYISSGIPNWIYDQLYVPIPGRIRKLILCTVLPELCGLFLIGLLLGLIWSPCSGPTLGYAYGLAANRASRMQAIPYLALFAIGAAIPLLVISYSFRLLYSVLRPKLESMQIQDNLLFGAIIVFVGSFVISGIDKIAEAQLLNVLPGWMLELSTNY